MIARLQQRQGFVSIMTIVFMLTIGMVVLFTLAILGQAATSQARLQQAAQTAAQAAVEQSDVPGEDDQQIQIACDDNNFKLLASSSEPICRSGEALDAAQASLRANLACDQGLLFPGAISRSGNSNACTSPNVELTNGGIDIFNLNETPGASITAASQNILDDDQTACDLQHNSAQFAGTTSSVQRVCWREESVSVDGAHSPVHFTSGVIVRLTATIPLGFLGTCDNQSATFSLLCQKLKLQASGVAAYALQTQLTETDLNNIGDYDPRH